MPRLTKPPAPVTRDDEWLTKRQAGEAYPALGERYITRLIEQRRIPFHRLPGRVLLKRSDIEAYLEAHRHDLTGVA